MINFKSGSNPLFVAGTRIVWPADPLTARTCDAVDCLRSKILPAAKSLHKDILPCEKSHRDILRCKSLHSDILQPYMRCQEEIRPFYTAATIISQALQEHTSWASWALNIGIWPIVNIIKRYKVDSLCTPTIKIWQKICLNFVIPARWCPWYYFWSGDCQAKRSPSLHFVPMYLKYIFIPLISLMHI